MIPAPDRSRAKAKPKSKGGRWTSKAAFSLSVMLFCLLLIEGLLWLFDLYRPVPNIYVGEYSFRESPNFLPDPVIGWRMRPDRTFKWPVAGREFVFASDADGFRRDTVPTPDEGAARKIVALGDSFMWGYGVEYDEICTSLAASRVRHAKVRNLALPSFGADQIWLCLREWGLKEKPDLVIVGFYTNDFERVFDASRLPERIVKPLFKLVEDRLVRQTEADRPSALIRFLEHRSRLYGLWTRLKRRLGFNYGVGFWWKLNEAILDAIVRDCDQAGVPVLFLHFPFLDGRSFPALNRYMAARGLNYIDLVEEWGGPRPDLYFVDDPHLNVAGHAYVAEKIVAWIRENLHWELTPP